MWKRINMVGVAATLAALAFGFVTAPRVNAGTEVIEPEAALPPSYRYAPPPHPRPIYYAPPPVSVVIAPRPYYYARPFVAFGRHRYHHYYPRRAHWYHH